MYCALGPQRFRYILIPGVVWLFGVATGQGGWPHCVPNFSEEATWTENDILLAEVVSAKRVPVLRERELHRTIQVTVTVVRRFTPGEPSFQVQRGPEITLGSFVFPSFREFNQPNPIVGETVVIVSSKRPMWPTYLLQPGTRGVGGAIAETLQAISQLRLPEAVIESALRDSLRTETDRATRDETGRALSAIDAFDNGHGQDGKSE